MMFEAVISAPHRKVHAIASLIMIMLPVVICCAASVHAEGAVHVTQPESVFIPQAESVPASQKKVGGRHRITPKTRSSVGMPKGSSGTTETFGGWVVTCGSDNGKKFCTVMQAKVDAQTGQRVFAIELRAPKNGSAEGTILMPFGLKLENGVVLRLDDKDVAQGLHFSTCVAQGCLVPLTFPNASINAMGQAKTLTVGALSINNDQSITFSVALEGFAAAISRAAQIAG